ncbi:class III lanthipeptide [Staphylococcus hominis]|nr:class III lanthipeptide [Staphylococcus hominis]
MEEILKLQKMEYSNDVEIQSMTPEPSVTRILTWSTMSDHCKH